MWLQLCIYTFKRAITVANTAAADADANIQINK